MFAIIQQHTKFAYAANFSDKIHIYFWQIIKAPHICVHLLAVLKNVK